MLRSSEMGSHEELYKPFTFQSSNVYKVTTEIWGSIKSAQYSQKDMNFT